MDLLLPSLGECLQEQNRLEVFVTLLRWQLRGVPDLLTTTPALQLELHLHMRDIWRTGWIGRERDDIGWR